MFPVPLSHGVFCVAGRGVLPERAAEPHPEFDPRPDQRGAAGVEAAAADRLHRRPAQRLRGPAAELVRRLSLNIIYRLCFYI